MNIYFNRAFTTTAEVIKLLKKDMENFNEKVNIFISTNIENFYLKDVADYFFLEPEQYSEEEYAAFCLDFCKTNKIDIFIPRNYAPILSKYADEFKTLGTKVLFVGDQEMYKLIDDKAGLYTRLKDVEGVYIPPYSLVSNYTEFVKAYTNILVEGFKACIKPNTGIGGQGYRKIEDISDYEEFLKYAPNIVSLSRLKELFLNNEMELYLLSGHLNGKEFSVDCLAKDGELVEAIPRYRIDKYTQKIENNEELIEISKIITKELKLSNLYNIQFKYHNDKPYLIEINSRMSGGIYKSCIGGTNLLHHAILLNEGMPFESSLNKLETKLVRNNVGVFV